MLTHRNLLANALQVTAWGREFIDRGNDMYLCVIPFFHSYGQTVAMNNAIFNASTMVLIPQFEINMMLQAIQKYEPNFFPGVPTIYVAILSHPDALAYGVNKIKLCNSGSAPLPVEVHRQFSQMSGGIFCRGVRALGGVAGDALEPDLRDEEDRLDRPAVPRYGRQNRRRRDRRE